MRLLQIFQATALCCCFLMWNGDTTSSSVKRKQNNFSWGISWKYATAEQLNLIELSYLSLSGTQECLSNHGSRPNSEPWYHRLDSDHNWLWSVNLHQTAELLILKASGRFHTTERLKKTDIRLDKTSAVIYTMKAGSTVKSTCDIKCDWIMKFMGAWEFFWVGPDRQRRSCCPRLPTTAGAFLFF